MSDETRGPARAAPRFRPYPKYKDSGVEWLGEIPAHWEVKPLKAVSGLQTGLTLGKKYEGRSLITRPYLRVANVQDGYLELGDVAEVELPAQSAARYELREGDVLMTEGGDFDKLGRGHVWEDQVAGCLHQNHIFAVRPRRDVLKPRFLAFAMSSSYGRAYFTATSKQSTNLASTNSTKRRNLPIPMPNLSEQDEIVFRIDRETARIDALVAKKERLIELLQEKRTALITRAVTKGLDPNVPMKDSGVEWLGKIPAHWGIGGLSHWWQVVDCKHRTVPFLDEGIPLASIGEVQSLEVDLSAAKRTTVEEYREMIAGGREPRRGDVVYSRNATVGAAALVTTEEPFCMGQDVSLIRAADQDQRFLVFLLRSPAVMGQLDSSMVGSTFNRINVSKIKQLVVCVPLLEEQRTIAAFCQRGHQNIEQLILKVGEAIDRLKELRTALISAAVTGKIDVREEAAA